MAAPHSDAREVASVNDGGRHGVTGDPSDERAMRAFIDNLLGARVALTRLEQEEGERAGEKRVLEEPQGTEADSSTSRVIHKFVRHLRSPRVVLRRLEDMVMIPGAGPRGRAPGRRQDPRPHASEGRATRTEEGSSPDPEVTGSRGSKEADRT